MVGDENGIIRFFDHDLKLLRWTQNFQMPRIECIAFNMNDELASFKKHLSMIQLTYSLLALPPNKNVTLIGHYNDVDGSL